MNISYEGIDGVVVFLKLVAATGDEEEAWRCLGHPDLAMLDLEDGAERRYGKELVGMAKKKGEVLTHGELQEVVDVVKRNCELINQLEGNQKIHSSDMTLYLSVIQILLSPSISRNHQVGSLVNQSFQSLFLHTLQWLPPCFYLCFHQECRRFPYFQNWAVPHRECQVLPVYFLTLK